MLGKNTYLAVRKIPSGSITTSNAFGSILDGAAPFSVDAMVRVIELVTDKSVLKIDGVIDFGLHEEGVYAKLPGYPAIYSNNSAGTLRKNDWIHIAVTSDGSRVSVYIDGVLNCSTFCTSTRSNSNANIVIGDGFTGDIRYVRVFSEFLDADTVKEIMHETSITQIPLAWFDFTQNPAKEIISNSSIELTDVSVRSFTTAVSLLGNSYIEVPIDELLTVRPGYYDVQNYSVQLHFKFDPGDDGHAQRYDLLSDMGEYSLNGINLWLEKMDDGYHLCFLHAFVDVEDNKVVSVETIKRGAWTNVAVTFDVDTVALYVNGKLDTKKDGVLPAVEYDDGRKFIIGASYDDALNDHINFFAGYISQCDVWTKTLSEAEVYEYIDADPEPETVGLGFSLTIDRDGCFNGVTYNAVSLGNHARVIEEDCNTVSGVRETVSSRQTEEEPLTKEELIGIYELCCEKWNKYHNENGLKCGTEMPYMVKALHKGDMVYFVGCYKGKAYTIGSIEAELTTEEITWWVELILMIIGGVCSAIFGLQLRTGSRQLNKLINLFYSNVKLVSSLKVLLYTDMSASAILQFCKLLYKENVLIDIIKLVIMQVSFWSLITICTKFASLVTGYGWAAAAVQLAVLVVEVGLHIASYPNEDKKQQPGSVALAEVDFAGTELPRNSVRQSIESHDKSILPKSTLTNVARSSPQIIDNGRNNNVLSTWAPNVGLAPRVAVYSMNTQTVTLRASFVVNNPTDDPKTVELFCEGNHFYGESNREISTLQPHTQKIISCMFSIPVRVIQAQLSVIDDAITFHCAWRECGSVMILNEVAITVFTTFAQAGGKWTTSPLWYDALTLLYIKDPSVQRLSALTDIISQVTYIVNSKFFAQYQFKSAYASVISGRTTLRLSDFINTVISGEIPRVNCSDCAALVTTFCNLLGIELRCERMMNVSNYHNGFYLNPIIPIGYTDNWIGGGFAYHEVAMRHLTTPNDTANINHKVYDASLQVNISNPPDETNWAVALPCGMSFSQYTDDYISLNGGNVDLVDDSYREYLCVQGPTGIGSCYYVALPIGMAIPSFE